MDDARTAIQDVGVELEKAGSNAVTKLRSLVSRDKFRVKDQTTGVDLDLTYITDRIIAMGIPAQSIEVLFRNNIDHVAKFLDHHHRDKYRIFNLSEKDYDDSKFSLGSVNRCGWPDHHAPPLPVLFDIVQAMDKFLAASVDHVVAVHCLAGRGRTGTVIACYLLYTGLCSSADEALDFFAEKRSRTNEGVAVPSQKRYVNYFLHALRNGPPPPQRLVLQRMEMQPIPGIGLTDNSCAPYVQVLDYNTRGNPLVYTNESQDVLRYRSGDYCMSTMVNTPVEGDVLIRVYHQNALLSMVRNTPMFKLQFHTSYLTEPTLSLTKRELDNIGAGVLVDKNYTADFTVTLFFSGLTKRPDDELPTLSRAERATYRQAAFTDQVVPGTAPSKADVLQGQVRGQVPPSPVREVHSTPNVMQGRVSSASMPGQMPPPPVNRGTKPADYTASPSNFQDRLARLSTAPSSSSSSPSLTVRQSVMLQEPSLDFDSLPQPGQQQGGDTSLNVRQSVMLQEPVLDFSSLPPPGQQPVADTSLNVRQSVMLQEPALDFAALPQPSAPATAPQSLDVRQSVVLQEPSLADIADPPQPFAASSPLGNPLNVRQSVMLEEPSLDFGSLPAPGGVPEPQMSLDVRQSVVLPEPSLSLDATSSQPFSSSTSLGQPAQQAGGSVSMQPFSTSAALPAASPSAPVYGSGAPFAFGSSADLPAASQPFSTSQDLLAPLNVRQSVALQEPSLDFASPDGLPEPSLDSLPQPSLQPSAVSQPPAAGLAFGADGHMAVPVLPAVYEGFAKETPKPAAPTPAASTSELPPDFVNRLSQL